MMNLKSDQLEILLSVWGQLHSTRYLCKISSNILQIMWTVAPTPCIIVIKYVKSI